MSMETRALSQLGEGGLQSKPGEGLQSRQKDCNPSSASHSLGTFSRREKVESPVDQGRHDLKFNSGKLVSKPELDDYMDLFRRYGKDFGDAYLEPEDDRFRFLFDQILRLLAQPSAFNLTLPEPFRTTAYRYLAGDEATIAHMKVVENRHFMLSDVYDYLHLIDKMGNPKL